MADKSPKFERCVQDVKSKNEKDSGSETKPYNPWAVCHASLKKCIGIMRKGDKLAKFDGMAPPPPPPPAMPPPSAPALDPSKVAAFQSGLFKAEDGPKTPSTPKEQVYKNIQSKDPTHTHQGHPVKVLHTIKTKRGDYHTFEFMGGPRKGHWGTGYGHELQPLEKGTKWKPWMDGNP